VDGRPVRHQLGVDYRRDLPPPLTSTAPPSHPEQGSRSEPPSKGSAMHAHRGKGPCVPAETWTYVTRRLDFARRDMRGASTSFGAARRAPAAPARPRNARLPRS
jgi:hypothetical protein